MTTCNKDCFNCPHPDCIRDDIDYGDILDARKRDKELTQTAEQKKIAARKKAYYEANREEIAARKKAYYEANREENSKIGAVIRTARKAAGLTQQALARLLGVSRSCVAQMELGYIPADLERIAKALPKLKEMI